jgi:orotate phosphoribosyltransferase
MIFFDFIRRWLAKTYLISLRVSRQFSVYTKNTIEPFEFGGNIMPNEETLKKLLDLYRIVSIVGGIKTKVLCGSTWKGEAISAVILSIFPKIEICQTTLTTDNILFSVNGKKILLIHCEVELGNDLQKAIEVIHTDGGKVVEILVFFDNQKRSINDPNITELQYFQKKTGIRLYPLIKFSDIVSLYPKEENPEVYQRLVNYQDQYCIK